MSIITIILNIALVALFLRELIVLKKVIAKKSTSSIIVHLFGTGVTGAVAYIIACLSFNVKIDNEKMIKVVFICAFIAFFFLGLDSLFMEKGKNDKNKARKKQKRWANI